LKLFPAWASGISERVSIRTNRCFQRRRVRVRRMF
jgi:Phosphoglycerol transferase and related proteins, alkaline phosphatase superfamily